jgi:ABC-type glycerol-3-phosphate transport system substrate-binding protein
MSDVLRTTMSQARKFRAAISRRHFMQLTAAAAAAATAPHTVRAADHGPGWYSDPSLKGKVTMFTFAGQRWGLPTQAVVPLFKERFPNVDVDIVAEPFGEAYTKIQLRAASGSSSYNTAWVDSNQMTALNAAKALENLEPYLATDKKWADDYFADVPANVTRGYRLPQNETGQTYALTCDSNAKLMYFRRDLFDKAGIKGAPETWDRALEIAKELHRPQDNQYGFVTTARRGLYAGLELYQLVASYGGVWFNEHNEPQFNTEIGSKALSVLMQLMKYAHPVTLNAADDEVNAALANGSAVFAPMEWGTSAVTNPKFTQFAAVFEAGIVPKGETNTGRHAPLAAGFGQYINVHGTDKRIAWEFIKHLNSGDYTDPAIGEAYVKNAGQPARTSLLKKYVNLQPYFGALGQTLTVSIPGFPWIPEAFTLADQLGNEVVAAITGEKSPEAALAAIDKGQRRIMQEAGYYK